MHWKDKVIFLDIAKVRDFEDAIEKWKVEKARALVAVIPKWLEEDFWETRLKYQGDWIELYFSRVKARYEQLTGRPVYSYCMSWVAIGGMDRYI